MAHTYRSIYFHLVFHTKRTTVLPQDIEPMHAYMHGILEREGCKSITIGGIEDHIHILAEFPFERLSSIISTAKTAVTRWLKKRDPKAYALFSWQRGHGLFSVSYSLTNKVRQYIKRQREKHRGLASQDEYVKILNLHHIDYVPDDEPPGPCVAQPRRT